MGTSQANWTGSEAKRWRLTGRCGLFAVLGWAILELFHEVLLGPHVQLVRSMAIGSGIGTVAGLLASVPQWLVLRRHLQYAGWLVPATTAGATLSGLIGGLLLYYLNHSLDLYEWDIPLQGSSAAAFVGLATTGVQWVVLRRWATSGQDRRGWITTMAVGSLLGAASTCMATLATIGVVGFFMGEGAWPYNLILAYPVAAITGGVVYGHFVTRGLRQVLAVAKRQAKPPVVHQVHGAQPA